MVEAKTDLAKTDQASSAHERDLMALPLGSVLGRYRITAVLGRGGFGITYRAHDAKLDREVAIKEYLPATFALRHGGSAVLPSSTKWAEDFARGRQRFLDEGRTLASLQRTPSIVQVFDFLEANSTAYIVMDLVPGVTLEARLRQTPTLSSSDVEKILWPLLDGLQRVHEAGFLHRDIKPANIILGARGEPTLIDFGASRAAMVGSSAPLTVIYTPGYAAAEQFSAADQGPWTDIYGLAATLYQAITGDRPTSAVDRVLEDTHRPLADRQPAGYPRSLLLGIDAGLAVRARDRPQSIAAWRSLLQGRPPADRDDTIPFRGKKAGRPAIRSGLSGERRRQAVWVGFGALILLAGGGGYYAWTIDRPSSVDSAARQLTADELVQALEERRKADAAATEKKRLEEEAQRRAEADAEAKRQADAELEKARQERQKAEQELARLKADLEARQKADAQRREQAAAAAQRALEEAAQRKAAAEIAALRKAEEDAATKAAADAASKQRAGEEAQRKAEAEAAASRQAEEEARRKADAEAEAKRQADEALAKAQAERQRADEEAKRKADDEAKRKAEADAKTRAEAEAKAKADAEAQQKAAAEAKAKADLEAQKEAQKKAAEQAEAALRLAPVDRQRAQVALTALGFDTGGSDGVFGPRSRDMITAWQKARNQPATGFVSAAQLPALLKEAAAAVAKFDDDQKIKEQKKAEEEKSKKVDEAAKAIAAIASGQPSNPAPALSDGTAPRDPRLFDGPWKRDRAARCAQAPDNVAFNGLTVRDGRFSYTSVGEHHQETCTVQINPDGTFQNHACLLQMEGRFSGDLLQLSYLSPSYGPCTVSARRGE
ncbi:MAG: protein kinase [Alphaproteobacteria bacterium]|nr:protein kinase [Alphaproteobacteria bacterium]